MWARTVQVLLGCWLAISPFIFAHAPEETVLWANDFACAVLVITFALLSFWRPTRYAHLLTLAVGGWLIAFGYLNYADPAPAALQNDVLVGWLLLMFGIIPNEATRPPDGWEQFTPGNATRGPR